MSAPDFARAAERMFAVNSCVATALGAVRTAMDAEPEGSGKADVWRRAEPILLALIVQEEAAAAAFRKAKQEAGL